MERMRYLDRPHLCLCRAKCGCRYWRVRFPRRHADGKTQGRWKAAIDAAKRWNLQRFCGVGPCEKHICH